MKILQKVFLVSFVPTALAAAVLLAGVWHQSRHAVLQRQRGESLARVEALRQQVLSHFAGIQAVLAVEAARLLPGEPETLLPELTALEGRLGPQVDGVFLNRPDGEVRGTRGERFSSRDRYYYPILRGGTPVITRILTSKASGRPSVVVLVPRSGADGGYLGALGASVPVSDMLRTVREFSPRTAGAALLVDETGRVEASGLEPGPAAALVARVLAAENGEAEVRVAGVPNLLLFTRVQGTPWTLVLLRPHQDLLLVRNEMLSASALILLATLAIGWAGYGVLRRIVLRPVQRLTDGHAALARGDRSVRAEGPGRDEFGALAASFNHLAEQLQRSEDELHRHQELESAIAANIPGVVFRFYARPDGARGLSFVGERSQEFLGIAATPHETFFERFLDLLDPDQREPFLASIDVAVRDRCPWAFEGALLSPAGQRRWFHARSLPGAAGEEVVFDGVLLDITERKRAEEALRESEANLQAIMANTTDIIASYDRERRLVAYNQACSEGFRRMFGVEIQLGLRPVDLFPESARGFWDANNARVLQGESFTTEFELPAADHARRVFETSYHPIRQGLEVVGFMTTTRDVTERKGAEDALRESEKQFKTLFELTPYSCAVTDLNGRYLLVNQAFRATAGLESAAMVGRTAEELGFVMDATSLERVRAQLARSGAVHDLEADITWADRTFTALVSSQRIEFGGRPALLSIIVDVSSQKRAERALRESEERFRLLLHNSNDIITVIDEHGKLTLVVGPAEAALGYTPEELLGTSGYDLVHPDDLDAVSTALSRALADRGLPQRVEYRARHKSGRWLWVEAIGSNQLHDQAVRGVVLNIRDISARIQAEEEREKLQMQLIQAQKMESVGRLAGGVAHDFNNMLSVILGQTELALTQVEPAHPLHADLLEIRVAAERSADLTRQLLAFARKQTIDPKVLDINETVDGMLKMIRRLVGEDIDLVWLPGPDAGSVKIDPSQVDQVVANLCINARDAIAGTGRLTIETSSAVLDEEYCGLHAGFVPGEYVLLAVSDNGCGMDADTRSHLFEPFFTTKATGRGTGLGLATVFGITRQNNGFINVYSEPGHGSTFKIYLPRHHRASTPQSIPAPAPPTEPRGETILLVEDEEAIRQVTVRLLRRLGYNVVTANTPMEAIRLATAHAGRIDLLLTDVVMPEMNGRDLARNLVSLHPGIKCLFMSGYTANVIVHHGVLDEGVHFLQKPFSGGALSAKIREALAQA